MEHGLNPVCGREGGVSIDGRRAIARWVVVEVGGVARWRDKLISETPLTPDYDLTECAARAYPMDAADEDRQKHHLQTLRR